MRIREGYLNDFIGLTKEEAGNKVVPDWDFRL